jgi:predicted ferric reductase
MGISALAFGGIVFAASRSAWLLSPFTWYLTRAAGITLYLLLWLTTALGLGLTTSLLDRFGGRAVIYSLHRYATELAYGFLALHLLSLALDQTIAFRPVTLLAPFVSPWREPWTGLGVVAAQLMVIIGVSFALRRWIGQRGWRVLHTLGLPMYLLSLIHAIGAGSDADSRWLQLTYALTSLSILWLASYRVFRGSSRARPDWSPRPAPLDRLALAQPRHPARKLRGSAG